MNPWWLVLIVPTSMAAGAALIPRAICWLFNIPLDDWRE